MQLARIPRMASIVGLAFEGLKGVLGRVLVNGLGILKKTLVEALRVALREALKAMLEALMEEAKEGLDKLPGS